ncbi:MAG: type II secretion system F family protein [Verrucomicrobia bacterium]|nr:type II secretion system F family protein [Verrucomicrobiota bacterium]
MALLITPRALAQRGEFYYQLCSMIRAGLPVIGALQTLEKSPPSGSYRKPVARMLTELKSGNSFVGALDAVGDWLPVFDKALLEAGEKSGRLDECFRLLSSYYEERAKLVREVIGQMIYPACIVHFALLVFPVNLLVEAVLRDQWLPLLIEKAISFGTLYGVGAAFVLANSGTRALWWRAATEQFLGLIPVLGAARRNLALARHTAALEALFSAGVGIVDSWELAARASGSPAIAREVMKWRPQIEVEQKTPGEILADKNVFPDMFTSLYRTGEISGQLDDTLKRLHEYSRVEGHRQMQMFTRGLTISIILLIMIAIGIQVVMFWIGYFNNINNVLTQ